MSLIPERKKGHHVPRFEDLTMLIYGEQGAGKTSFFSGEDDPLICAVEPGSDFIEGRVVPVNDWETFCQLVCEVHEIKKTEPHKISSVVIDIIDGLHRLCEDYVCRLHKAKTVKDVGGYGQGHAEVRKTFTEWLTSLYHAVPIRFITHQTDEEYEVVGQAGLLEKHMKKVAQFNGRKGELIRGWCQVVGHMYVNENAQHVISFKKNGSKLTKDRTGFLDALGDVVLPSDTGLSFQDCRLAYPYVEKKYEEKVRELGFELQNYRRPRHGGETAVCYGS
jgi:hypothetical protein